MNILGLMPAVILVVCIPLYIGCYVYWDAKRRGMNALLWALIAIFVPSLIGLLIYLLVRGHYVDLECPQCHTSVKESYVVCPHCGTKLRPACANCGTAVEPDWKVCPKCAHPLPENQPDIQPAIQVKDKSFRKVLAVVIAAPLLLLLIMTVGFSAFSGGGVVSFTEVSMDEYFAQQELPAMVSENVKQWLDGLPVEENHAYALRYDEIHEDSNQYMYLVYVPGAGNQTRSGISHSSSIFGAVLTLRLDRTGNDGALFCIYNSEQKAPKLKIELNGKRIPCDLTVVDYNPTLYSGDPNKTLQHRTGLQS